MEEVEHNASYPDSNVSYDKHPRVTDRRMQKSESPVCFFVINHCSNQADQPHSCYKKWIFNLKNFSSVLVDYDGNLHCEYHHQCEQ